MSALRGNASDTFSDNDDDVEAAPRAVTPTGQDVKRSRRGRHEFDDVSLRLHRLYRAATADEALAAAEDRFDEAAEMVVANTPSEIRQLGSCRMRMVFRILLYGSYVVAVAIFFSTVYKSKMKAKYLAADRNSGDCESVWTTLTGTHHLDIDGRWDTDPDFEPQRSLFVVDFARLPAKDYQAAMGAVADELRAIVGGAPRSLLESLLLATTRQIRVLDGVVSVSFDVRAESFMDLPTGTAGFAGCPSPYSGDFAEDLANPAFQYDIRIENGALVFRLDAVEAFKTCQQTRSGKSLWDVLGAPNSNWGVEDVWGKRNMELSVHLQSIAAATAINYGLIEPSEFLDPLDSAGFSTDDVGIPLCPRGYCAGQGFAEDECNCGVCGSFGSCGWSCDPGAGGENVPTGNNPGDFKICESPYEANYTRYTGKMGPWGGTKSYGEEELQSLAEQDCVAYPQASWGPSTPNYFQDKRFPGMDPIVCVDDAAGNAVCSVLAGGGLIPVYPAFRFFNKECNMCERGNSSYDTYGDWRDWFVFGLKDDGDVVEKCKNTLPPHNAAGLDFLGGLLVGWRGGGIFHEQPQLVASATSRQWDDITWLGWTLALEDYGGYSSLGVCPLHDAGPLLVGFTIANDNRGEVKLNANQYQMNASEWVCNNAWVHDDVFDRLAADVASAPVPPQFDYYKCTPAPDEAREEAIGIAMGGGGFVFLVVAFLLVHVLVRALDKMGRVEFRNGRFIPPGAIDEWLEHEAVTSIMREKASEAKRPGTSSIPLPTIADVSLST